MLKQAITLEALEVLDAIDRKGSFAAAASILFKVPSAITYTVQKLEQNLGVTLFVKQGRQSVLTAAGRVLLEQGREILEAAERLTETTRQVDSGWESTLNIAIDNIIDTNQIFVILKNLFEMKPDIEVNLYQEILAGGWEALSENRVDIAIGMPHKTSNPGKLKCIPYSMSDWVFAVHNLHPLALLKHPLHKTDIECYRTVVVRDSSRHQPKLTHRLFSRHPVLSVQTIADKIAAQKEGLGVGYLPRNEIAKELASGELIELIIEEVHLKETHYLGWRQGEKGKAACWFINTLTKNKPINTHTSNRE